MWRRVGQFRALSPAEKRLFVQAWMLLGWYRVTLCWFSLERLTADLERHRVALPPAVLTADQLSRATAIGALVSAAARFTPWQSRCLVQVLVAQYLLGRRAIPGQFYLGVRRGSGQTGDPGGLSAHAWLQCGETIVNGAAGHESFTVIAAYRWGCTA